MTQINIWLQTFSNPFLDNIFLLITSLCSTIVFSVFSMVVYWCIDKKKGLTIALLLSLSLCANSILKNIFKIPRPFTYNDKIRRIDSSTSYGYSFPSGHSQLISTTTATLYMFDKNRRMAVFAVVISLLVAISRVYLGVHTVADIIAGLFFGTLIPVLLFNIIQKLIYKNDFKKLIIFPIVMNFSMIFFRDAHLFKITGLITFLVIGIIIDEKYIKFSPAKKLTFKMLDFVVGLIILLFIQNLKSLFPSSLPFLYIRYSLVGLWAGLGAPFIFSLINKFEQNAQK